VADDVADSGTGSTESGAHDPSSTSVASADAGSTDWTSESTGAPLSAGSDSSDGASSSDTSGAITCGDGVQDGTEQCDDVDFGGATCASVMGAQYDGALSCMACVLDTSGCCVVIARSCLESNECCSGTCSNSTCIE
jgi:hypothetical protein